MQYRNALHDCQLKMLSQVYEPLIGLILPELCRRCGTPTNAGFCAACRDDFAHNEHACSVCGCGPLTGGRRQCPTHKRNWHVTHVVAPLLYAPPLERYLHALKYSGERAIGRCLGQILADAVAARCADIDAIVSVPLHAKRLAERGYNQALEIARAVSASTKLPILRAGIMRTRATSPQARLNGTERYDNLAAAFSVTRQLAGKRLAIVDDVITTGATINALATALMLAGATHVEAWAVARTQRPRSDES
jgi:ComF family protein